MNNPTAALTMLCLALAFPFTAAADCWQDDDCEAGTVCYCHRSLIPEAERCDELGGQCALEDLEDPQRLELQRLRAWRSTHSGADTVQDQP